MKSKITIWLKRYLPAELFAVLCAVVCGIGIHALFHNMVLTALAGTWGDNLGYYGTIIASDLRKQKEKQQMITLSLFLKTIRNMFFEFGIAEFFDSFLIRPFSMYLFPLMLQNVGLGLLVGKVAADIIFYIPTITSYEILRKFGKRSH